MKVLLDACTPRQVRNALGGHDVRTAPKMGWGDLENGDLLREAEQAGFDALNICDKNMRYQQNLANRRIAILELWTNHRPTLEADFGRIRAAADRLNPGDYVQLGPP